MKLFILLLLFPLLSIAHPGIGIVADNKGNVFYTDLENVWKITNGKRTIAVPNVHSHELYIDQAGNLYGEQLSYDGEAKNTFQHYLWILRTNGKLDTVITPRQAYVNIDFSLSRDQFGNEYYIKNFITRPDTSHIYKRTADGKETIFAKGNYKGVSWLHAQKDGSLLFVLHNSLYEVSNTGQQKVIANSIASEKPSFTYYSKNKQLWGSWKDNASNYYVAIFSDQQVKKISVTGKTNIVHASEKRWTPIHGVVDINGKLWIMETSDKNEVRVVQANPHVEVKISWGWMIGITFIGLLMVYLIYRFSS